MPPPTLFSLEGIDTNVVTIPIEEVRKTNPQRYEMEQLTGVIYADAAQGRLVAERKLGMDEWWVRGHIPGRPLFPGVLMIETAAQASAFLYKVIEPAEARFIGFGGVDDVKFRGQVLPGERMIVLVQVIEKRPRRAVFATQGFVGDRLVFQANIIGMPI